jgi:hypothetical protein
LGIIIGANLGNRCASAQSNFPMCVTVYKYLVWPGTFPKTTQVIPVTGTGKEGELQASGFEVVGGALKFPPSNPPSQPKEGMIYYDKTNNTFYCYKLEKQPDGSWKPVPKDCGGGGTTYVTSSGDLIVPVKIWRDANKTFTVLEITEE